MACNVIIVSSVCIVIASWYSIKKKKKKKKKKNRTILCYVFLNHQDVAKYSLKFRNRAAVNA